MADRSLVAPHSRTSGEMRTKRFVDSALRRFFTAMLLSKEIWFVYISAFLCGRASLGSGIYPFGLALFWTVVRSGKRTHAIGAFFAILLGMWTVAPVHRLLAVAVVLLGGLFVHTTETAETQRQRSAILWRQAFVIAVAHIGARIAFSRLFQAEWETPLWMGMEAILVATTIVLWRWLSDLWGGDFHKRITREGWTSIAVFAVMLSLGLGNIQIGPYFPAELWNRLITLGAALIGGPATGAAVGTALGWFMGMSGVVPLGGSSIYALPGLFAGLFAARGKIWVGMGFLFGHLVLSIQTPSSSEIVQSLMHALMALALLALIPNHWLRSVERTLPGSRARERFMQVREERLKEAVSERLSKVSGLLSEMGRTFAVVGGEADGQTKAGDMAALVQEIMQRQCQKCPGYRTCWEEHLYQSYTDLVEFIEIGQSKGILRETAMPMQLRQRCFRSRQLTQTAHGVLAGMQERDRWQRRLEGQNHVVPVQLQGVASLIEGLAEQVQVETGRSDELQVMLADALRESRIVANKIQVRALGACQRFEILVERSAPCDRIGLWREKVAKTISSTLPGQYSIWKEECGEEGPCRLWFTETPSHHLEHASVAMPKEGGTISGDTLTMVDLIDGRIAILLSDGMGSGAKAALQSDSAVQLLGTLLETGFNLRSAVRSVNSLLLMRTSEESFATLDAVVIDRFTGMAEFLKVGSAPTFIKRGSEVEVIRSASLPIGIVNQFEARVQQRPLQSGDMIVMVTDGLLDSLDRGVDQEEWIARVLRREESDTPQGLLDATLQRVKEATGNVWADDVTVTVIRYTEWSGTDKEDIIPEYRRVAHTN